MDAEARHYQDQLHQANQERMTRFEDKLDRTLNVVVQIGEAIKCIPSMEQRIKDLESERDQRKGAIAVIAFLCGLLGAGIAELAKHWLGK